MGSRDRFAYDNDQRRPVVAPDGVQCYAIVATTGKTTGDLRDQLLGDGRVPPSSALGYNMNPSLAVPFPESQRRIGYAMHHLDLPHRREVYEQMRQRLPS